jgi:hypothetical protein
LDFSGLIYWVFYLSEHYCRFNRAEYTGNVYQATDIIYGASVLLLGGIELVVTFIIEILFI